MIDRSASVPNRIRRLATAIVLTVALASTAQSAHAVTDYLTAFEAQYPAAAGSRIDTCNLCHTAVPQLNPYGMAYQDAGHQFAPIETLDSDGDGYTNLAEIMALTFPGDPADTPAPVPTATTTPLPATATATATTSVSPTATPTSTLVSTTATVTITSLSATATITSLSGTATPTITGQASDTPTVASSASPTNTSGPPPTITPGSPTRTNTPGGQTVTPGTTPTRTLSGGSPTVSPTTSAARTATVGPRSIEDDGCSIVAPERSSSIGGLVLLLAPALVIWASRRRL